MQTLDFGGSRGLLELIGRNQVASYQLAIAAFAFFTALRFNDLMHTKMLA